MPEVEEPEQAAARGVLGRGRRADTGARLLPADQVHDRAQAPDRPRARPLLRGARRLAGGRAESRSRARPHRHQPAHVGGGEGAAPGGLDRGGRRGRVDRAAHAAERRAAAGPAGARMPARGRGGPGSRAERHLTRDRLGAHARRARRDRPPAVGGVGRARRPGAGARRGRRRGRRRGAHADRRTDPVGDARAQDRRPGLDDVAADPVGRDRAHHRANPRRRRPAEQRRPARRRRPASRRGRRAGAAARGGRLGADADRAHARADPGRAPARWKTAPRTACCCSPRGSRWAVGARGAAGRDARSSSRPPANPRYGPTPTQSSVAASSNGRERTSTRRARSPEGREILRSIFVRVWAELGRTHLPLGGALELAQGAVVDLDQSAEAPVELFANGLCFANGSLVVTGDGAWGVQVDELLQ